MAWDTRRSLAEPKIDLAPRRGSNLLTSQIVFSPLCHLVSP